MYAKQHSRYPRRVKIRTKRYATGKYAILPIMQKTLKKERYDVIVIGAGPAGMMAGGRCAELGARVLLLEKNAKPGVKLLLTGGGRSNITNNILSTRAFLQKFGGSGKFLFSAFSQFGVKETLQFFHERGMATKLEAEGRVFPATEKSETVQKTLLAYCKKGNVAVRVGAEVREIRSLKNSISGIVLKNGEVLTANSYILATGGTSRPETGSTGDGFRWLQKLGVPIRIPEPALTPIRTKEAWGHKLSGLALGNVRVTLFQNGIQHGVSAGKILFTHIGLSGPTILNMSRRIGELLRYGEVTLMVDLFPDMDNGRLDRHLQAIFAERQNKKLRNVLAEIVPKKLAEILPEKTDANGDTPIHSVTRAERIRIVKALKHITLTPTSVLGPEKAVVVSGGVLLPEVDGKTMALRKFPNLFVVGDMLHIDRPSGGYSLQLCWTTGFVAGSHARVRREDI